MRPTTPSAIAARSPSSNSTRSIACAAGGTPSASRSRRASEPPSTASIALGPLRAVQTEIMCAHGGPVRQDDLQLEDVIAGLAVLHAAVPGGVVPDHPADPTQVLGSRVGSEAHSALRQMGIQLGEEDPGLDANESASGIELEDSLESRGVHHHPGTNRGPG